MHDIAAMVTCFHRHVTLLRQQVWIESTAGPLVFRFSRVLHFIDDAGGNLFLRNVSGLKLWSSTKFVIRWLVRINESHDNICFKRNGARGGEFSEI